MAEELGITIRFQGESLGFDKSVTGMEKAINTLKREVRMLNKDLKIDPSNIVTLTNKVRNLYQQLVLQKKVSQDWRNTIKQLATDGKQFTTEWTEAHTELAKSEDRVREIKSQMAKVSAEAEKAKDSTVQFAEAMNKASTVAKKVSDTFDPISKASQNFLKEATQGAIDFESAFADVRKTVKSTGSEYLDEKMFAQLKDDARELAKTLPVTASQVAKIMGLAGQMNVPVSQMTDFTKAMIEFGDSTNITAEEAVTDIAQIYNVIGKGGDYSDLNNLLSAIVELGNNSATTEKDITTMFKNISAGASRVKMTEAQMVALSATLSSLGLDKGGASAISRILQNIDTAVTKGGQDLKDWAKIVGMSGDAFKQAWSKDSADVLLDIVSSMSEMTDEGISMNKILSDLDIKELRQVDTLSRLVKAHQLYADNIELANNAYGDGTALTKEALKRYETLASQIQIVKNNFQEFALTLGEILMPYIQELLDFLQQIADWLNALDPQTQNMIVKLVAFLAVIAPIAGWIATITGALGSLNEKTSFFQTVILPLFTHIKNFVSGTFTKILGFAMSHPILTAIVALIAIGVVLYNNVTEFRNEVILLWRRMKDLWKTFQETNWIERLGNKMGWLGGVLGWLAELVKNIINLFGGLISSALEFLGISSQLGGVAETAREMVGGGGWNVINSGGYGALNSGGFASGGITLNASFNVQSNNVTRDQVRSWSEWLADDINEALGRRI